MTLYVDSSAFVKRHLPHEVDHEPCVKTMDSHADWITSRISTIEVPRAISRTTSSSAAALAAFDADVAEALVVELDHGVAALARAVALETGLKTLDAIHIASAKRIPDPDLEFLTYDKRQATAAAALGLKLAR